MVPIDDVFHFDVITSTPSTGAAVDADSTPTFAVYEEATDTDIGVGGNLTKRTALTGNYRGSFTCSAANGFEAGKWYSVIASAVVGGVTGKAAAARFRVAPAESVAGVPQVDVAALSGDSAAADNAEAFFDGTGYAGTGNVIPTVTTLTGHTPQTGDNYARLGAPAGASVSADVAAVKAETASILTDTAEIGAAGAGLTALGDTRLAELEAGNLPADISTVAAGVAAVLLDTGTDGVVVAPASKSDYALSSAGVTAVQSGLATSANQTTILARLGSWTGSARNTLLGAMQALFRSDADATVPSDINADLGSGVGDAANTHDSLEAIRDRGDAAWTTGGGVSGSNTVTFTVRDSVSLAALVDVPVNIYASDGTSLVDSKRSSADGGPVFSLDSASYYYAVPAIAGYSSVSNTALTVDGVETVTVNLVAISSASTAPGTRVVRCIVRGADGALESGVVVTARLLGASTVDQAILARQELEATSDANGIADLTCITADQFTQGAGIYAFDVPNGLRVKSAVAAGSGVVYLEDLANA